MTREVLSGVTHTMDSILQLASDYVHEYATCRFSLNEVADYAGVTTYHLCHRLREKTGLTVFKLRDIIRIETAAMALMRHEDIQVKRVAYDVGYSSCSYFCRQFRLKTGLTPGQFKRIWPGIVSMTG